MFFKYLKKEGLNKSLFCFEHEFYQLLSAKGQEPPSVLVSTVVPESP